MRWLGGDHALFSLNGCQSLAFVSKHDFNLSIEAVVDHDRAYCLQARAELMHVTSDQWSCSSVHPTQICAGAQ